MSSLWTPGGERPIRKEPAGGQQPPPTGGPSPGGPEGGAPPGAPPGSGDEPTEAERQAVAEQVREMTERLARTPAEVVVANHAFGLFELAALHLSQEPPQLDQARIAIDAFTVLVDGMTGRLGEAENQLHDGLAQLRLAFVQINAAQSGGEPPPGQ
jgi:sugar phosphate isomerase/epimerase